MEESAEKEGGVQAALEDLLHMVTVDRHRLREAVQARIEQGAERSSSKLFIAR